MMRPPNSLQRPEEDLPLASLIHISDLHFGRAFSKSRLREKAFSPFGVCVHSYQASRALALRIGQIVRNRTARQVPTCVVVTGDLTRSGDGEEFLVASTFLRSAHSTGAGRGVGLLLGEFQQEIHPTKPGLFVVPGNHDIWSRRKPDALGTYKHNFPGAFPTECRVTTRSRPVVLYGLDSTQNTALRHKLARGRIPPEQLEAVYDLLTERVDSGGIQIVCLHHPLDDPRHDASDPSMELDNRVSIARGLVRAGADLVLAGHLHRFYARMQLSPEVPARATAGSSTQRTSEANFVLYDVYSARIELTVYRYSTLDLTFVQGGRGAFALVPRTLATAEP